MTLPTSLGVQDARLPLHAQQARTDPVEPARYRVLHAPLEPTRQQQLQAAVRALP